MAGTKRSSSASDEEGQDHPASAGPRSSPSAIDNTTETLLGPPITGSSNVVTPRKDEIEQHVDPNLDASRTHQCDKALLSESQNILRKPEGEYVNAHPNVSGATQCDEPSSSGSSNLPVKSEGEHVDVTKPDVIRRIKHIDQADGEKVDVNLDELVDHISQLLKLREEEMLPNKKASNLSNFPWPEGFRKLNAILSWGTDLKNLKELLSSGLDFASKLKEVISGPVTTILKDRGQASLVTAGLLVVAYTLERVHDLSDNKDGCWVLIKEMSRLASVVKALNESPQGTLNVIEDATTLVVEGAIMCCTQIGRSEWKSFLSASKDKADLSGITQKLNSMYLKISVDIGIRNLSAIERVLASNDNQAKRNSGQDLSISRVQKENMEKDLLLELDGLLTNRRGDQFHLSPLPPNTLILVTWRLWQGYIIEEMIDQMQIKVIYIGPDFDKFSTKVKDNIFVVDVPTARATQMLEKVHLTLNLAPDKFRTNMYLQIDTRMQVGDEYRPCWRFLEEDEMKEFVVSNCKRYLRLKQLQAERDEESSNIELLTELFAAEGDETTPVFQKNESSVQEDPTANSEVKATCGVDKLEGKTILLEMRPPHSLFYDIRLPSLKEMYLLEKERHNFEIISIPLVEPTERPFVFDVYKQFSREVPWLVLQNPWTAITREVQYFLAKHWTGWEEDNVSEECYPSINWIIDPNGRITIYRPPISPGDMSDRGEVFEVFFNYLERHSYQVRWGVNAPPPTWEKIEEVWKNEWQQVKNMSTLEFLFNHLEMESVSVEVKSLMRQGKFICFFGGSDEDMTWFMRSAMEQFRDSIHFIHFIHERRRFPLEEPWKVYYHPLENTSEMEGTSLSRHETVRFIMRLRHLEEEIYGMEQSDEQLCELKSILHSLLLGPEYGGSFTFFDKVGKMVGALNGEDIYQIFEEPFRQDKVERLINSMLKEGGKEMHDEDSSLIRKMQTASASAVEQQNADVYFDALRDYISELWGVQLYQLCKLNKEGKKRSPPRVTWPTWSRGLCRLKNLLSEGENEDWVKYVIFPYSEKDALNTVVKRLVKDIGEAEWAVAGLLAVADLLERFETFPSDPFEDAPLNQIVWLSILDEMFRLAQYSKQFNQKAELWRRMKCGAIVVILRYSIICCWAIDRSKFEFSRREGSSAHYRWLKEAEKALREECDTLAQTMMEDLDNESGSLANLECYKWGFDLWLASEDEGGPSSEYKRSASFPDLLLESKEKGGPSSEYKRSASFP